MLRVEPLASTHRRLVAEGARRPTVTIFASPVGEVFVRLALYQGNTLNNFVLDNDPHHHAIVETTP